MKLAPCPDCKRMISLAATTCPNCGRPIQPGDLKSAEPTPEEIEERSRRSQRNLVIVVVLLALMTLLCVNANRKENIDREFQRTLEWERQRGIYR